MSRLHAFQPSSDDVAALFGAEDRVSPGMPGEVVEGGRGVAIHEAGGRRTMRAMRWGFPRPARGGGAAGIVGLVADITNPMWEGMAVDPRYRCVVPIARFANPDGMPGRKTRTWFSVVGQPTMAWAGFCRNVPGVGPVYAGLTMEANAAIPPTNDRMPLLLEHDEVGRWLHASVADVIGFQFRPPFAASRMVVERTDEPWRGGGTPPSAELAPAATLL